MAITDVRPLGGKLLPAPDPTRKEHALPDDAIVVWPEAGTADATTYAPGGDRRVSLWNARFKQWRDEFENHISSKAARYWSLWRNFSKGAAPSAGMEWRDRTVVPQAFKELATRVPRIILGMWGVPEPFTVQGRGFRDTSYEEMVRILIQEALDEVGLHDPQGELFLKRMVDGETYCQVVGHVWWKIFWRHESHWLKTKIRDETGNWSPIERLQVLYDNVDVVWLPISQLAVDVFGKRRWVIERVDTTLEALQRENDRHREAYDEPLYPGLPLLEVENLNTQRNRENTEEPEDFEGWPLQDGTRGMDPTETPVELWLCWDNVHRTLTKLGNRKVVLDHGLAPSPDGLDPYIGEPAVPIPGRVYGDSIFNWTKDLYIQQTRLARARTDQTIMNMFTNYLVREGSLGPTQPFLRPGGITTIGGANVAPDRPISDHIFMVPQKPLPPEAFRQEAWAQQQSEATAAADSVGQGAEATQKSRDVTAAEVNQRIVQGASRYQMEVFYKDAVVKKPLCQKTFDLLQQNMTQAKMVQVMEDSEAEVVDLTKLNRPVDIVVGSATTEATQTEKMQELERITNMDKSEGFRRVMKHREIFEDIVKGSRTLRRTASRYVRTEEEIKREEAQAAVMALQAAQPAAPDASAPPPPPVPAGAEGAGQPGRAAVAGPTGTGPEGLAAPAGGTVEEI